MILTDYIFNTFKVYIIKPFNFKEGIFSAKLKKPSIYKGLWAIKNASPVTVIPWMVTVIPRLVTVIPQMVTVIPQVNFLQANY